MNGRWPHIAQVAVFIGGGIACLAMGNVPLGAALIGAAIGNALPTSLLSNPLSKPAESKDPQ